MKQTKISKLLVLLVALFSFQFFYAQSEKEAIKKDFVAFNHLIVAHNFDEAVEYIPTDFFKIFPKNIVIDMMERVLNDPSMEFKLSEPVELKIQAIQKIGDRYYAKIQYKSPMSIRHKDAEHEDTEDSIYQRQIVLSSMKSAFKTEQVVYNETTRFYDLLLDEKAIAISDNGHTDWKFLVLKQNQRPILEKILPKELLEEL